MKNLRKTITAITFAGALAVTSITAFAATYGSPAEAVAGLTGKSAETVLNDHWNGTSYGSMAKDAGKLEEFQAAVYELHEERLKQDVADEILKDIKERQENCDGTGDGREGAGRGRGMGKGAGRGAGMGRGLGSCVVED